MSAVIVTILLTVTAAKPVDPNALAAAARNGILAQGFKLHDGDGASGPSVEISFVSARERP